MKRSPIAPLLLLLPMLLAGCAAPAATPQATQAPTLAPKKPEVPAACPVTQPPATAFVPPAPWPAEPPPDDNVWVGTADLWTAIPAAGMWPTPEHGFKFPWWSQHFDVKEDDTPDLYLDAVTIPLTRDDNPPFHISNDGRATNMYHHTTDWAMLTGLELPPGCWEITASYKGHEMAIVLWVGQGAP